MNRKRTTKQPKKTAGHEAGDERSTESVEPAQLIELSDEEADRMVTEALDCELDEPESFVKVLLFLNDLHNQGRGPELGDSLHR